MERDWSVVKKLLLQIECGEEKIHFYDVDDVTFFHLSILKDGGYIVVDECGRYDVTQKGVSLLVTLLLN